MFILFFPTVLAIFFLCKFDIVANIYISIVHLKIGVNCYSEQYYDSHQNPIAKCKRVA